MSEAIAAVPRQLTQPSADEVERVAGAIYGAYFNTPDRWQRVYERGRQKWCLMTRAAIAAMDSK
jgi:hypothetical protein